jgi:threonylcarbamoyladenosine tRNA methylthiotransferase MtaB
LIVTAKLKTETLGCKVNQYETQLVREGLLGIGYQEADRSESADLCIVNTCTITAEGDSKSRQVIRRLHRQNPDARIVVMGCYATREPTEVAQLPGVSEVVTDKRELPDLLGRFGVIDIPSGISGLNKRHRAYVKVQDGCLLRCSYCIIPTVRPTMFSRPVDQILDEVSRLADNGFREVILTGIHLGHYGVDFNKGQPKHDWTRLSHLVQKICDRVSGIRVRLSSIEATEVTRELIGVMRSNSDRVCPHLHVCLQSGSDRILRLMKRRWSRKHIIDRCQLIAEKLIDPAFTTDVIVGFPGETEQDFEDTLDACRRIGFSKIHMFPFSARKGTPAAQMDHQIPKPTKTERGKRLAQLESELKTAYLQRLVGRQVQLLVESSVNGTVQGTSCRYLQAQCESSAEENELVDMRVTEVGNDRLIGISL